MAQELAINPNTIQRAYAELEREGIIYSLKGRGSFVGSSLGELRTVQQKALLDELAKVCRELKALDVSQDIINAAVAQVYAAEKEEHANDKL